MTVSFVLPDGLSATAPPESRGVPRDGVRLLVARAGRPVRHRRFRDLAASLAPGDLVVVNTSTTVPAAVAGTRGDGRPVVLHVSGPAPGAPDRWVVELRTPGRERVHDGRPGEVVTLPAGAHAVLVAAHPDLGATTSRLWRAIVETGTPGRGLADWLELHGRPITYPYLGTVPPIEAFRTVLARPVRGFASAEMPSAGRPFTRAVLDRLAARGVGVAELVLHTGVSSPEVGEPPLPERFRVPARTADAVNRTRAVGGRVVAVGTTVTRALETVADEDGTVRAGSGWTDLVLGPHRPARVTTGLVTGWHEPQASHLLLLEAVAGRELVAAAYGAALAEGYLWHEFGDSCLLLPRHGR
ncbi:S-adenosylmethionine:tRNA ribosyltransferase-isomerase [Pseudonocardia sp. D17]|jgi:S-adenosylmethionine:tRNA ribosyltransferase-isomerase|uniref:S-adenosylmethionine:tRNA ribosyltransferase-isomerase n=1 Tax=Pseudonocardia sp. D17 TaxID=882661 RepID=UPI0030CE2558|nr:queuosine biosynthesis protein [Pseudonocardia sp. D17]